MKHDYGNFITTGIAAIFTAVQDNPVFQWISLGLTILSFLLTIAYTIWKWYKKAMEDKKITPEELEDLKKDIDEINKEK